MSDPADQPKNRPDAIDATRRADDELLLRVECERLAADPADIAEAQSVLADMAALREVTGR